MIGGYTNSKASRLAACSRLGKMPSTSKRGLVEPSGPTSQLLRLHPSRCSLVAHDAGVQRRGYRVKRYAKCHNFITLQVSQTSPM